MSIDQLAPENHRTPDPWGQPSPLASLLLLLKRALLRAQDRLHVVSATRKPHCPFCEVLRSGSQVQLASDSFQEEGHPVPAVNQNQWPAANPQHRETLGEASPDPGSGWGCVLSSEMIQV